MEPAELLRSLGARIGIELWESSPKLATGHWNWQHWELATIKAAIPRPPQDFACGDLVPRARFW